MIDDDMTMFGVTDSIHQHLGGLMWCSDSVISPAAGECTNRSIMKLLGFYPGVGIGSGSRLSTAEGGNY